MAFNSKIHNYKGKDYVFLDGDLYVRKRKNEFCEIDHIRDAFGKEVSDFITEREQNT